MSRQKRPWIVEIQEFSRAIADVQIALADSMPEWFKRLTGADTTLREWALARRKYAEKVELAWWAAERGEFEPWNSVMRGE